MIPHGAGLCLLDQVVSWDEGRIECLTDTHRDPDNPLRDEGGLPAVCALEYGAQAMAVHGALLARAGGRAAPPGWLAGVRDAGLYATRLDRLAGSLRVSAESKMAGAAGFVYDIAVSMDGGRTAVAAGRLIVMPVA